MPFSEENNTAGPGRPKGSPNKVTAKTREAFQMFVDDNAEMFKEWLQQIDDPVERINLTLKVAEFVMPKLSRQQIEAEIIERKNPILEELKKLREG